MQIREIKYRLIRYPESFSVQNRHLMSQARRMRRIANCRVRLAWFINRLLCVMQAGVGGRWTKISHTWNIHLKKCIQPKQGERSTHKTNKQTNTQKMKHASVNRRSRTRFQNLPSGDRFWCSKTPLTCGRKANTENTKISRYVCRACIKCVKIFGLYTLLV